ncbi:ATP-binding cassette domain-containing protein [Gordonia insulae]|uniref:Doxorubicin resistance ATP-binding protein DrrA n=1 Tax=Gordonia insulae TaxID=2420509 RepID=A0A3G8JUF7_9ACTN|nr:ATP-binding cassette domain-containing protein [Gordonia insulae]AZG48355.1 Doxorubicin resistance ATP-binding protein DrrA [Gordonia insulae]
MAEAEQYRRSPISSSPFDASRSDVSRADSSTSGAPRRFRHAAPSGANGTVADVLMSGDLHVDLASYGLGGNHSDAGSATPSNGTPGVNSDTPRSVPVPAVGKRARHAAVDSDESPTIPIPPVSTTGSQVTPPSTATSSSASDASNLVPPAADTPLALDDSHITPPATEVPTATDPTSVATTGEARAEIAIEVVDLHKRFGDNVAVESVSFSVAKGSILALLGPNGAGKTTTVNMLCTLLKPDGGTATVAGHDVVSDAAGVRRSIMLTGQFAALDEALSGRDNLILFGRLMGLTKSAARSRADELLTSFDLTAAAKRKVGEYSGGMRRRIDIACGLVTQPEVVFLDEPTTGLDPRSRQEVWNLVESLRDQGVTTLLTTQYLEEADTLSDHIVVIDRGRVIASGTADELKTATGASHYEVTPANPDDITGLVECLRDLVPAAAPLPDDAVTDTTPSVAVPAPDGADTLVEIVKRTTGAGIRLSDVALRRPSLDEVFLALTDPTRADPAAEAPVTDARVTDAPVTKDGRDTSA